MSRNNRNTYSIDWLTVAMYFVMVIFGWMNIYGATYNFEQSSIINPSNVAGKQFIWICTSLVLATIILILDAKTYDFFAYFLYIVWLLVLLATPIIAKYGHGDIKGSLSWIRFSFISIQPAEFAKFITALCLAKWMSRYEFKITGWRSLVVPLAIICIPMFIIMVLQKEAGTALVFAAFFFVLYREGMSGYVLLSALVLIVLFILTIKFLPVTLPIGTGNFGILLSSITIFAIIGLMLWLKFRQNKEVLIYAGIIVLAYGVALLLCIWFNVNFNYVSMIAIGVSVLYLITVTIYSKQTGIWILTAFIVLSSVMCLASSKVFNSVLAEHQRKRIEVILKMKTDPTGVEYNVTQAKIAIGSGGFFGKGYKNGTQTKLNFVPEQHTDFILCTIGEDFGFVGTGSVLVLFLAFILRLIKMAERQKDMFSQIYGYCVVSIFIIHLIINIGMVLGFLPVIGIPLPFYSYGGSSLIGFTVLLFIFIKLDASRVEKL